MTALSKRRQKRNALRAECRRAFAEGREAFARARLSGRIAAPAVIDRVSLRVRDRARLTLRHGRLSQDGCAARQGCRVQRPGALQHYLAHKNTQHTVRYTKLSPDRFRDFWRRNHPISFQLICLESRLTNRASLRWGYCKCGPING
jgi:hypothetical protein